MSKKDQVIKRAQKKANQTGEVQVVFEHPFGGYVQFKSLEAYYTDDIQHPIVKMVNADT